MVKKLNRIQVQEKLRDSGLQVFSPREFYGVFGVSQRTGSVFLSRNLKSGLFLKLRNNYYLLKDNHPPLYIIANKLYQPSYVSLESALSHYGILPETVYAVTSVTTKATREFNTPRGVFSYQRIKKSAFSGYLPVPMDGHIVHLALPEKALVDYIYFAELGKGSLSERLNLKKIRKDKLLEFAGAFGRESLVTKVREIYAQQRQSRKIY